MAKYCPLRLLVMLFCMVLLLGVALEAGEFHLTWSQVFAVLYAKLQTLLGSAISLPGVPEVPRMHDVIVWNIRIVP